MTKNPLAALLDGVQTPESREKIDARADELFRARNRQRGATSLNTIEPQSYRDYFVVDATVEAVLAALEAAPPMGVKVKPLEWFEAQSPSRGGGKYTSDGYTIRRIEGLWLLDFAGNGKTAWRWVDLDAAKAAAQADYETRVLAALEEEGRDG